MEPLADKDQTDSKEVKKRRYEDAFVEFFKDSVDFKPEVANAVPKVGKLEKRYTDSKGVPDCSHQDSRGESVPCKKQEESAVPRVAQAEKNQAETKGIPDCRSGDPFAEYCKDLEPCEKQQANAISREVQIDKVLNETKGVEDCVNGGLLGEGFNFTFQEFSRHQDPTNGNTFDATFHCMTPEQTFHRRRYHQTENKIIILIVLELDASLKHDILIVLEHLRNGHWMFVFDKNRKKFGWMCGNTLTSKFNAECSLNTGSDCFNREGQSLNRHWIRLSQNVRLLESLLYPGNLLECNKEYIKRIANVFSLQTSNVQAISQAASNRIRFIAERFSNRPRNLWSGIFFSDQYKRPAMKRFNFIDLENKIMILLILELDAALEGDNCSMLEHLRHDQWMREFTYVMTDIRKCERFGWTYGDTLTSKFQTELSCNQESENFIRKGNSLKKQWVKTSKDLSLWDSLLRQLDLQQNNGYRERIANAMSLDTAIVNEISSAAHQRLGFIAEMFVKRTTTTSAQ